VCCSMETSD
ncbi:transketolase, partial [Vibrio parahaemolyticus 3256]